MYLQDESRDSGGSSKQALLEVGVLVSAEDLQVPGPPENRRPVTDRMDWASVVAVGHTGVGDAGVGNAAVGDAAVGDAAVGVAGTDAQMEGMDARVGKLA